MAVKADDGGVVSEFKTRVINGLQGRLLNDNYWETEPMVASVFDPSTKDLRFLTEETRETVYDNVKRALDVINSAQEPEAAADAEPVAKKSAISVIASFLGSEITNIESADQHFDEFQSYLSCRISDVVNPLEWWCGRLTDVSIQCWPNWLVDIWLYRPQAYRLKGCSVLPETPLQKRETHCVRTLLTSSFFSTKT